MDLVFGLVGTDRSPIPLESIKVVATVRGFTARVQASMQYVNNDNNPVEAMFVLPVEDKAAVCGFEATVDGKTIVAEVREKQEARDMYDDAISSGQKAFLLEKSDQSSDIFVISIGNLPPQRSATIVITYVTELAVEKEGSVVFFLPTVLNPRYTPVDSSSDPNPSAATPCIATVTAPYVFEFDMMVECSSAIESISSPSIPLTVQIDSTDKAKATVQLAEEHTDNRDIEIHISTAEPFQPHVLVEAGLTASGGQSQNKNKGDFLSKPMVMLNYFPDLPDETMETGEFIFVVDESVSMYGDCIQNAREAVLLFLKSLPSGCRFNIVEFGSTFRHLFESSAVYNDDNLHQACKLVEHMSADLGGTEILAPLKWIFNRPLVKGFPRQVFLLTDGEVGNTNEVIRIVQSNAKAARCFAFGVGDGVSTALINGVARAGHGTAEFVLSNHLLQTKVIRTLKRALQPSYDDVTVSWSLPDGWNVDQIPSVIPPLFCDQRLVVYGILEPPDEAVDWRKTLKGTVKLSVGKRQVEMGATNNSLEYSIDINPLEEAQQQDPPRSFCDAGNALSLHRLAAKSYIQEQETSSSEWDVEAEQRAAVIELSTKANVISQFTSFIAVDKANCEPVSGPMADFGLLSAYGDLIHTGSRDLKRACYRKKRGAFGIPLPCLICCCPCLVICWCGVWCYDKCSSCCRKAVPRQYGYQAEPEATPITAAEVEELKGSDQPRDTTEPWKTSADQKSRFMRIISLQKASGSWELSSEFAEACDSMKEDLEGKCPGAFSEEAENATELWATALALVLLVGKFARQKDEWEMVKLKGKKWLEHNNPSTADIEEIFAAACKVLSVDYPIEI